MTNKEHFFIVCLDCSNFVYINLIKFKIHIITPSNVLHTLDGVHGYG